MRTVLGGTLVLGLGVIAGWASMRAAADASPKKPPAILPEAHAGEGTASAVALAAAEALPAPHVRSYRASAPARAQLARAREGLAASPRAVENPCVERAGGLCLRRPLDRFYRRLDELDRLDAADHAVVSVIGNSLIAADGIVDVVRDRLQTRFGDGGRGLLLAEAISELATHGRTGRGDGWDTFNLGQGERGRYRLGLAGAHHVATRRGARSVFRVAGQARAQVLWLSHKRSPGFEVRVDGEPVATVKPDGGERARVHEVALPDGAERLEVRALGAGLVVQGVALERAEPGVVLETLGLPASDSLRWLRADEDVVKAQLEARRPALVTVMLGGVENRRIAWGRFGHDDAERALGELLARVRAGAPEGSCLVVGPIDSVAGMLDEKRLGRPVTPFVERRELREINERYRRTALASGCAFFDLFRASGGSGSLKRMARHGWLHDDHVHPRGFGLDALGELIAHGVLSDWERARTVDARVASALNSLDETAPAVRPHGARVRALAAGDARAVAVPVRGDGAAVRYLQARLAQVFGVPAPGLLAPTGRIAELGVVVEPDPGTRTDALVLAPAADEVAAWRARGLVDDDGALTDRGSRLAADAVALQLLALVRR